MRRTGWLARTPVGPPLIELLGHMTPVAELSTRAAGIDVAGPVGLGIAIDPSGAATKALSQFGFGFLEIGPVTMELGAVDDVTRLVDREAISMPSTPAGAGVDVVAANVKGLGVKRPVGFRLAHGVGASAREAAAERVEMLRRLGDRIDFVSLDCWELSAWSVDDWRGHLEEIKTGKQTPIWLTFRPDVDLDAVAAHVDVAVDMGIVAISVAGGVAEGDRRLLGAPEREATLRMVAEVGRRWGGRESIVAGGGIMEPGDAVRAMEAGASLVQIDVGMVYNGPGLPKRTNEAILSLRKPAGRKPHPNPVLGKVREQDTPASWIWTLFLGLSMIIGGGLAALIALTRVVLPYDEAFIGMGAMGIEHVNRHLLPFMTHDRISLAGTMVSIGVLYTFMAVHGVRRGARWAWTAIIRSSTIGFVTFFLFLGFGYFDPLHAFVSAILFVFFLLAFRGQPRGVGDVVPDLVNDAAWRRSVVGQFLFVTIGIGLILAGVTISGVGITNVFVPTDLMFLHTTRHMVMDANPHLVPLIAHDRAGFGGTLWSDGVAVVLLSLWGFRRGARWVWYALLLGGLPGFIAALGVHIAIGYMHFEHLFPVYLSIVMFTAGLALSRRYLCGGNSAPISRSTE